MDSSSDDGSLSSEFSDSGSEESFDDDLEDEMSQLSSQMPLFDDDIVSDDDRCNPPCHWSCTQSEYDPVALDPFVCGEDNVWVSHRAPFHLKRARVLYVLMIVCDVFLSLCVTATFEYGSSDQEFMKHLGDF